MYRYAISAGRSRRTAARCDKLVTVLSTLGKSFFWTACLTNVVMELPHPRSKNLQLVDRSILSGGPAIEFDVVRTRGRFNALLTYVSNWDSFSWTTWTARSCPSVVGILKSDTNSISIASNLDGPRRNLASLHHIRSIRHVCIFYMRDVLF